MSRQIMVIDYNKCVRYARGDEYLKEQRVPYRCPACAHGVEIGTVNSEGERSTISVTSLTPATFSGKLAPAGQPPACENHNPPVVMERV